MTSATKPKQKAPKKAKKSSIWQRIKRYFLIAVLSFFGISISLVVIYRFVNPPLTYLMVQRFVNQCIDEKYDVRFKHSNRDFKEVSDNLKKALIASEDQLFLEHQGFDFEAMEKAYENNAKGKKKIKGGSTISQQVAKNVFLWPGRSYIRKGFEAYFTLLIELCWSKERIMEVYLNVIEWGNGIYGSEAAAQYYFKKPAKKLSASQAALLAAIVPNPRRWSASKPSPYILKRQRWILRNMNRLGVLEF